MPVQYKRESVSRQSLNPFDLKLGPAQRLAVSTPHFPSSDELPWVLRRNQNAHPQIRTDEHDMKETAQRRTRSFGGCPTCRTRRIKCDETRPSCTACLTAGLSCQGYRAKLRFVFYEPRPIGGGLNLAEPCKGKEESGSRQQLYTGEYFHRLSPPYTSFHTRFQCSPLNPYLMQL